MAIAESPALAGIATWTFEPGHSEAEFKARHMMVSWVKGFIKNVRGKLRFDAARPTEASVEAEMDAADLWTGLKERDDHLRSPDFLDAARFPKITFKSRSVRCVGADELRVEGDLTLHGVTRSVTLDVRYLGQWETPWWEGGRDLGPKLRAGFEAMMRINRKDFGVLWNEKLDRGGKAVSEEVLVTLDIEAVRDT